MFSNPSNEPCLDVATPGGFPQRTCPVGQITPKGPTPLYSDEISALFDNFPWVGSIPTIFLTLFWEILVLMTDNINLTSPSANSLSHFVHLSFPDIFSAIRWRRMCSTTDPGTFL
mmetsp:Transcript_20176/g.60173  ORF Transcript_20176/g.60173 Transcript_20176/m.60173 type:complete len:115 (-) Transcript_20176:842-1186(-)